MPDLRSLVDTWDQSWVSFDRPGWLLLLPLLGAVVAGPTALALWRRTRLITQLQWLQLMLRLLVLLLASVALADPHWTWTSRSLAVVVVRDVSESIPESSALALDRFLSTAGQPSPDADQRIGEVAVAASATIRERPADRPLAPGETMGLDRRASDLAGGVLLAAALQSPDAGLRVLLASDGNETAGSVAEAARALAARSIPLDVLPLPATRDPWAIIRSFRVPERARAGSSVQASVELESSRPMRGDLVVRGSDGRGGEPLALRIAIELAGGRETRLLTLPIGTDAVQRFDLRFEPEEPVDADPMALRATALTVVNAEARALLVAAPGIDATTWAADFADDDLRVDVRSASDAPSDLAGWAGYDLVVLAGVSASDLGRSRLEQVRSYAEDLGGGVIVTGGRFGFAADWLDTPLEPLLPVGLRLPESRLPSRGAVALVIDRSGSMGAVVGATGRSQLELAKDAAVSAIAALSPADLLSVIAFDGGATVVVPLQRNEREERTAARIRSIEPGGGTDVFAAIEAAAAELEGAPVTLRHIVLLSDGNSSGNADAGVRRADELRAAGITLSTISIGDGADTALLQQLAHAGGGRYHRVLTADLARQLAEVMRRETETIRRAPIREGERYELAVVRGAGPVAGFTRLPPLTGYGVVIDTDARAAVDVRGPDGDPIVASWNHGLGRVLAFTGDPLGPWGSAWRSWEESGRFWRQVARWAARPAADPLARLAVEETLTGPRLVLTLDRPADAAASPRGVAAIARYATVDGAGGTLALEQVGANRFEAPLALPADAIALLTARWSGLSAPDERANGSAPDAGDAVGGTARTAVVRRPIGEWQRPMADEAMLLRAAAMTGGRALSLASPATLFVPDGVRFPTWSRELWQLFALLAAVLFVADVALRRLVQPLWDRQRREPTPMPVPVPMPAPASTPLSTARGAAVAAQPAGPEAGPSDEQLARLERLQQAKRRANGR